MKVVFYQCDWCQKREEPKDGDERKPPEGWAERPNVCVGYGMQPRAGQLCVSCQHVLDDVVKEAITAARATCQALAKKADE